MGATRILLATLAVVAGFYFASTIVSKGSPCRSCKDQKRDERVIKSRKYSDYPDLIGQVDKLRAAVNDVDLSLDYRTSLREYAVSAYLEGMQNAINDTSYVPSVVRVEGCQSTILGRELHIAKKTGEVEEFEDELRKYAGSEDLSGENVDVLESLMVNTHGLPKEIRPEARRLAAKLFRQAYVFGSKGAFVTGPKLSYDQPQVGVPLETFVGVKVELLQDALEDYVQSPPHK